MKDLYTKRLYLRKITQSDAEQIYHGWASDDQVTKYLTWPTHKNLETTKSIVSYWIDEYKKDNCYRYGIELLGLGSLIGMIDVAEYIDGNPMIGYVLSRQHWNHGYMSEACQEIIRYLFEEGFQKILISADVRNVGSNRVIEKCGFDFLNTETKPCSSFKPEVVTVNWYQKIR